MRLQPHGHTTQRVTLLGRSHRCVVSSDEARVLTSLGQWASLDAHVQRLTASTGAPASAIRPLLEGLRRQGLLSTREELLGDPAAQSPAPPTRHCVITAARPQTALRCVASLIDVMPDPASAEPVLVTDDSSDAAHREQLRHGLQAMASTSGARFTVVDNAAKRRLVAVLADTLDSRDAPRHLEALLLGGPQSGSRCGANRNTQQLLCAGAAFLSLDDDTVVRFHRLPDAEDRTVLGGQADPLAFRLFAKRQAVWDTHPGQALAPDTLHGQLLGQAPLALADEASGLDTLDDHALAALGAGRVRASMTGAAGDSGMGSPGHLLWADTPSLDRLTADEAHYAECRFQRAVLRAAPRTVITRSPFFMGACTAYDGAQLLPPFPARSRNSDGVFGAALTALDPTAWIGHLPWAVHHDPPASRQTDIATASTALPGLDANNLLRLLMRQLADPGPHHDPLRDTLPRAAWRLHSLCSGGLPRFGDLLLDLASQQLAAHTRRLERCLDARGEHPDWWARDVQTQLDACLVAHDLRPAMAASMEVPSFEQAIRATLSAWQAYAWALQHWPDIWSSAEALLASGEPIGQSL